MAKKSKTEKSIETTHYQHDDAKRKNIPSAAMEAEGTVPLAKRVKYAYSPHLDPVLRFDPEGRADRVSTIVGKACRSEKLTSEEQGILQAVGNNWERPWLEWAGKQEEHDRGGFSVDPVALHIHERVSAPAIVRSATRADAQRSLFSDPQQAYAEAIQFYRHDVDWANRLILGDSVQVMSSLAHRESLGGKVQMIYMDPPYGIGYKSNFQPAVGKVDVKDGKDADLTREPEMVRAFRDTWHLGTSSYLSYLKERLLIARELLHETGSLFVQISDANLGRLRILLDEVFGSENFVATIPYSTTSGFNADLLASVTDYVLWYARDIDKVKCHKLLRRKQAGEDGATKYRDVAKVSPEMSLVFPNELATSSDMTSQGAASSEASFPFRGRTFVPPEGLHFKTTVKGLERLAHAGRLQIEGQRIRYIRLLSDFAATPLTNVWTDIGGVQDRSVGKLYAVQTAPEVVKRCMLMSTDPGDLVLDPTCGSGTTPVVAEQWGRRWIAIDTSRVSLAVTRHRVLTSVFEHYATVGGPQHDSQHESPGSGFKYSTLPHIEANSIANNSALDGIIESFRVPLLHAIERANAELKAVPGQLRASLADKADQRVRLGGARALSENERRRWVLPRDLWQEWELPFEADADWPVPLQEAIRSYRQLWLAKMSQIAKSVADEAVDEPLVDQPLVVQNAIRVSGPFTVEGVIPEELSLGEHGLFDPTANEDDSDVRTEAQNLSSYLARMVSHLRTDGLTFLNNQRKEFGRLDSTFEEGSGSFLHADGSWDDDEASVVAVTFGPQYGPVTALQVEEAIRAAKRCTDLVIAGFSFDAETYAIVEAQQHPKLQIHIAQIRPDLNESMDGLLKNTPNSQLFSVFGQPDIKVKHTKDGWVCELEGVVIYNPADNTIRSANADKVAAWFLDSDYDGRCFCATQAFFPDRGAWDKIAKALGSQADAEAFEAFNGTKSLPFENGKHERIAVKVIDPRGNEVMAIRRLQ